MKKGGKREYGLSFVEMLVAIGVFVIIMLALSSSLLYFYRANSYSIEQSFAVNAARRGVEILVRDLREATFSDEGAYPLVSGDAYSVSFYSDIDRDESVEKVRYFLDGGVLKKGVVNASGDPPSYTGAEAVSVVSDNVRNETQGVSIFRYYDKNRGEIFNVGLNLTDVVFVTVNLIVNVNPNRLPNEFTLRSSATIRNAKNAQ